MLLNQDKDLLADLSIAICSSLMRFSLELNLFERRAIKTDYFTFNCTGNARRMADLSPGDSGGGGHGKQGLVLN